MTVCHALPLHRPEVSLQDLAIAMLAHCAVSDALVRSHAKVRVFRWGCWGPLVMAARVCVLCVVDMCVCLCVCVCVCVE